MGEGMPWPEASTVSLRREFVELATREEANVRELCRRFEVSPPTAYKWVARYGELGIAGLVDQSRRPHGSPGRTSTQLEEAVLSERERHPAWGGRKLRARLLAQGLEQVPSASTITEILRRHGRISPEDRAQHQPWRRFERLAPNELWQMDFKGHFPLLDGRCHPFTVLDDHSRFCLGLEACADERTETVRQQLTSIFRRYGMPSAIVADNGSPWGSRAEPMELTVWLWQLGVDVHHGRPGHPQTQGKDERFHRTLKLELLRTRTFTDLIDCQTRFAHWREIYNWERPHEALGMAAPASRYRISPRAYPERLPAIEYDSGGEVRKVQGDGKIFFKGRVFRVGKALRLHHVALKPTNVDGVWSVCFGARHVATIDLNDGEGVNHVPEHL
jgi:transposase InsO family protein